VRLTTVADAETVAERGAELVARLVDEALAARGVAHLALAGGTTPRRCHEVLAPLVEDWSAVHIWESDERAVPPDDPESNWRMIEESLLSRITIPQANLHRVLGELGADEAADRYEDAIRARVPQTIFDVIMCGLGPDGHTCSLFPGHPAVEETKRLVVAVHGAPKPPPDRVTFTFPLLHAARRIVLLAAGAEKLDAMAALCEGPDPDVPASLLRLGRLEVIVDDAASPRRHHVES